MHHYKKHKSEFMYEVGLDFIYIGFLVEFVRLLEEVIEECHSRASIGTCEKSDKWSKNYVGVFVR